MAAPAQRLPHNCSSDPKSVSSDSAESGTNLQNGGSMEDLNQEDVSGNVMLNNRGKPRPNNCGSTNRDMKMDNFQDGGPQLSGRPNAAANPADHLGFPHDRTRMNSEYPNYNQNSRDPMMLPDEYRNSQEPGNHGSGYGTAGFQQDRGSYVNEQHGGPSAGAADVQTMSSQQKQQMYSQYQRAGFPNSPRPMNVGVGPPPRSNTPGMGMGNYPTNSQQRFIGISQQGGPTPTLNQLLQAPNPLQRFQNSYGEYNSNPAMHKDQSHTPHSQYSGSASSPHGWSPTRGPVPYQQQQQMLGYRGQQNALQQPSSGDPSIKRPPYMGSGGSGGGPSPGGSQGAPSPASSPQQGQQSAQAQYGQQQQPYPNRSYPQSQGSMGSQRSPMGQSYNSQQQMGSPYGMSGSGSSSGGPPSSQSGSNYESRVTPNSQQQFSLQQQQGTGNSSSQNQSPQQENSNVALDELSSDSNSNSGGGLGGVGPRSSTPRGTPSTQSGPQATPSTPTSQQSQALSGAQGVRPVPSPSGSSGSRSMSPAIGQQQSIPMPPRPSSSSQSDSAGTTTMNQTAPLGTPGYNSQMAPPPMYGNKMIPMGNSSQLGPYPLHSAHYSQGNYRHQNSLMMQSYGQGQNNYGSPSPDPPTTGHSGYPPAVIGNRIPNHSGAPLPPQNFGGYHNSQYGASGGGSYSMNNMMPPPSQYPKSPGLNSGGAAQAAAQAAVIAAAASSATLRSPMYVRHHLQQKMYSGNYNSLHAQAPGASNHGPGMAPPSGSGLHPMGMPPGSSPGMPCQPDGLPLVPPTVSTPSSTLSESSSSADNGINSQTSSASTMGNSSTSVTQSISSPVPSASMMVSSPSMAPMSDMAPGGPQMGGQPSMVMGSQGGPPNSGRLGGPQPLPPPHVLDEASQASNASASSSLPDDRSETPKPNKPQMSHPPTPNTLPSPGAASMSSFHDEFESVSSPSWPRTPASPVVNNQGYDHHPIKRPDGLLKLYEISDDPERRGFLDKLIIYSEERGTPISQCPTISKQPLDLYRLYASVKERGGFVDVTKSKQWKEVAGLLGIGASSSAAYTLRKQYIKHILPYECKYDRGGIDPQPIINQVENTSRKKGKNQQGGEVFPPPSSHSLDGYPQGGYPGPYGPGPPGPHPGMMMNSEYPPQSGGPPHMSPYQPGPPAHHPQGPPPGPHLHSQVPNHMGPNTSGPAAVGPEAMRGPEGMLPGDPYSEEMPPSQYQRHSTTENYGYNQTPGTNNSNTMMPAYSSTQSSMSGGSFGYSNASTHQPEAPYNSTSATTTGTTPASEPYPHHVASEPGFGGNRNIVQDPYNLPPGSYPPNRTIGAQNSTQYPYQGQYDRERYESGSVARPASQPGPVLSGPPPAPTAPTQPEIPVYPPQQRYGPSQTIPGPVARDPVPPQAPAPAPSGFTGRPTTMAPTPYPGNLSTPPGPNTVPPPAPYPQGPPDAYNRVPPEGYQNSTPPPRMQTTLAQRLLAKNNSTQGYPPPQPQPAIYSGANVPPNKVAPPGSPRDSYQRDMYLGGPKRHPDFMKPGMTPPDQYPPTAGYPPQPSQQPFPDRGQYPYRTGHMGMPPPNAGPGQPAWGRDSQGRPYPPNSQGQYPMSRESWEQSRTAEGQPAGGPWSGGGRYGPMNEPYQNCGSPGMPRGMKMSPHPRERPMYMQPNKIGKKELVFPRDTVEGVRPVTVKRRKLQAKDVSPLEAWRLMMALKSGLLAESTWALDVLSVLLYDDNTVLYFGLNHLPGLLEAIMEHYRRCLNVIFNLAEDIEICAELRKQLKDEEVAKSQTNSRPWYIAEREWSRNSKGNLGSVESIDPCDKTVFLNGENYSFKTRCNKVVRCRTAETLFLIDPDKKWDCDEGFSSGGGHWQLGGGDLTSYIQTHFENSHKYTKFARVMETVKKEKAFNEDESDDKCLEDNKRTMRDMIKREEASHESKTSTVVVPQKLLSVLNCKRNAISLEGMDLKRVSDEVAEMEGSKKPEELRVVKQEIVAPEEEDEKEECSKEAETVVTEIIVDKEELTDAMAEEKVLGDIAYPRKRKRSLDQPVKGSRLEGMEEESYNRDEPSLCNLTPAQDSLARRCICLSSLLRNLSFVPGNDSEMAKHAGFLLIMGRLLLLKHSHAPKKPPQRHFEREASDDGDTNSADTDCPTVGTASTADSCSSLQGEKEWWWDMLHHIRENTMVVLANISGHLDLTPYPEEISLPILDGLLHWAVCPSSYAQDPLPNLPTYSVLSPQRLSLEALCKLSTMECNVDLVLATPPWSRMERLFAFLSRSLGKNEDQVLREFSVVLLSNLSQADTGVARAVALQGTCISQLLTFVEQAEQSALQVANSQGINALRENPELMGTTLDMVRRSAATLRCLAMVPENRPLFLQHQQRLLTLVMSQILDQGVASIVADVLYECSRQRAESPKSRYTEIATVTMVNT